MVFYADTDKGRMRDMNQDMFYIAPNHSFCVVADGMGGHKAGNVASLVATSTVRSMLLNTSVLNSSKPKTDEKILSCLQAAVESANQIVYYTAQNADEFSGMGTTLTLCCFNNGKAYFAHVGDSRGYLVRGGEITRLTKDHTMAQLLLSTGEITEEDILSHPQRHVITRAVGTDENVKVDTFSVNLQAGDVILLCSDGLTDMVPDAEILKMVQSGKNSKELVALANENGGHDNITVVIARTD